jgi:cysteine desulfurase
MIFTSGATESNNMILSSVLYNRVKSPRLITTQVEHPSIITSCEFLAGLGIEVVYLPVDRSGQISLLDFEASLTPNAALVSVQWANGETGVIQPIEKIGEICREHGVLFHTDAAQAVGKVEINASELPIDFLSFSGHTFHGPQGTGAIYARDKRQLHPMFLGGPQEYGLRAGTENVPGIVGLGKAAEIRRERLESVQTQLCELRDLFETSILEIIPDTEVNGDRENRICNSTNLMLREIEGQALVVQLDQVDIRCSQSSACANQRPEPSYVLRAMGLSEEEASSSVSFSFSELDTLQEVEIAVRTITKLCRRLRAFNTIIHNGHSSTEVMSLH